MKLASTITYRQQRSLFPSSVLCEHQGKWVAFGADGRAILGSAEGIAELCDQLRAAGVNPNDVVLERIEFDDVFVGGAEFQ